jgi:hypothetical protein
MANKRKIITLVFRTLKTLIICCSLATLHAQGSGKIKFPDRALGLSGGISQHLIQSLAGGYLDLNHEIKLSKKIRLHHNFTFTFHKGQDGTQPAILGNAIAMTTVPPDINIAPLKFITAGIQTYSAASTTIFSDKLILGAGPILRYQTTTKPESYVFTATTRPTTSGGTFLYRAYYLINAIRPHSFAAGGLFFMDVKLFKIKKVETKGNFVYQFDSQGDKLFSAGIKIMKPYRKTS